MKYHNSKTPNKYKKVIDLLSKKKNIVIIRQRIWGSYTRSYQIY